MTFAPSSYGYCGWIFLARFEGAGPGGESCGVEVIVVLGRWMGKMVFTSLAPQKLFSLYPSTLSEKRRPQIPAKFSETSSKLQRRVLDSLLD